MLPLPCSSFLLQTSLAGQHGSLWLSKSIFSRQVNFSYLRKVHLAHGKLLHHWRTERWTCKPFPQRPSFILLTQEHLQLLSDFLVFFRWQQGTSLFVSQTSCSTENLPLKPPSLDEGKGKYHSIQYSLQSSHMGSLSWTLVFSLYGSEVSDGLAVATVTSGNPFCKSCMNGIAPQC